MSNQATKVLNFLQSGQTLSASQARGMFGIENVAARVAELREQGHCIYTNLNPQSGISSYYLGTPTKRMVSLAYSVRGADLFA